MSAPPHPPPSRARSTKAGRRQSGRKAAADEFSGPANPAALPYFLSGGGEMGARMRAQDWSATPLGPAEAWPQSLKTVVRILLTSRYQMWMAWGPELTFFCNDAYLPTLGVKQTWALGASARDVWKEIWPDIGPRIDHVLVTGEATWDEGLFLLLERSGYPEETYHTFSYSPLADDSGQVVGFLCVVMEETDRIIGERRLLSLRELASDISGKNTPADVLGAAERQLRTNRKDLPCALLYLFDEDGVAALAAATGVAAGRPDRAGDDRSVAPRPPVAGRRSSDASDRPVDRRSRRALSSGSGRRMGQAAAAGGRRADRPSGVGRTGRIPGGGRQSLSPA